MLPTQAFFTILTFSQSLVWVDFIVKTVQYIMPQNQIPPLTALIVALVTSTAALFATGIILVGKHKFYPAPKPKSPESTVLRAIPPRK